MAFDLFDSGFSISAFSSHHIEMKQLDIAMEDSVEEFFQLDVAVEVSVGKLFHKSSSHCLCFVSILQKKKIKL